MLKIFLLKLVKVCGNLVCWLKVMEFKGRNICQGKYLKKVINFLLNAREYLEKGKLFY